MEKNIKKYNQLLEESKKDNNFFYRTKSLKKYKNLFMITMANNKSDEKFIPESYAIHEFEIEKELYDKMKDCDIIFIEKYSKNHNISIIKGTSIESKKIDDDTVKISLKNLDNLVINSPIFAAKRKLNSTIYKEK